MAGGLGGNEPGGDVGSAGAVPSQEATNSGMHYEALFTLRIEQEALLLSDVAAIFTAVTQLHTKLLLISLKGRLHSSRDLIEYLTTNNHLLERVANLTVASITTNSPLTLVVVVSEAVGKALASLIDAVSQSRIRYDMAKLELEEARRAAIQQRVQIELEMQQQAEAHEIAMSERRIELQARWLQLGAQAQAHIDDDSYREIDKMHHLSEACMEVINQLHPEAEVETRQMFRQAVMNNLLDLFNHTGLVAESVTRRESA